MTRLFKEWLLLPQRCAVHEPSATAVLADLHLGYSLARQRLGDAVPWRSVAEELQPLAAAASTQAIKRLLVAGDLFERGFDAGLYQQFLDVLEGLHIEFIGLIPGNHDRGLERASSDLRLFHAGFALANWLIVHGDRPVTASHAILGHWHPAIRWKRRKVPCFLTRDHTLILPAFSLDAAGVDVSADAPSRAWDRYAICGTKIVRIRPGSSTARPQRKTHDRRRGFSE